MKQANDEQLCKVCPNLYKNRNAPMAETCMCWGFDVGDGWFDLVHKLSIKLEALILQLPTEMRVICCAVQVKEKFGGLRFYMNAATDEMNRLIDEVEEQSYKICEQCGVPGMLRKGGWLRTECDVCYAER